LRQRLRLAAEALLSALWRGVISLVLAFALIIVLIRGLLDSPRGMLDTLRELAAWIGWLLAD